MKVTRPWMRATSPRKLNAIRSATSDVVRALAMGANACLMGRAMTFSHAAAGEEGAYQMLTLVKRGIELTLGSLGCPSGWVRSR